MGKKSKATNGRAKQKAKAQSNGHSNRHPRNSGWADEFTDDDDAGGQVGFRGFALNGTSGGMSRSMKSQPNKLGGKLYMKSISFVPASTNPTPPELEVDIEFEETKEMVTVMEKSFDLEPQTNVDRIGELHTAETTKIVHGFESDLARMSIGGPNAASVITGTTESTNFMVIGDDAPLDGQRAEPGSPEVLPFIVDTVGNDSLAQTKRRAVIREPSPAPSDDSEEMVVFTGRGRGRIINDPPSIPQKPVEPASNDHVTDDLLRALSADPINYAQTLQPAPVGSAAAAWTPAPSEPYWRKKKDAEKEEVPADSPKLDKGQRKEAKKVKRAEKSSKEKDKRDARQAKRDARSRQRSSKAPDDELSESDERNNGSEAAYDDYMQNLLAHLNEEDGIDGETQDKPAATIPSVSFLGPSMMVDGREFAEDEVLPDNLRLDESDEWEDEEDDDESGSESDSQADGTSSYDSSDLEEELEYTEREQWEDEDDLRQRRIERMTDSRLARLWAKQIELGIDGDELVIEDGDFEGEFSDEFGDLTAARTGFISLSERPNKRSGGRGKGKGRGRGGFRYPDASALADTLDQYGDEGFDIMDMDRPSLRPVKKGRKGKIPDVLEELSDEELKLNMTMAWDKDRAKKRQKKLEREELRRDGLLNNGGHVDLKAKYKTGMTMTHVRTELEAFLRDDTADQRAFPPMFKHDRKALHDACNRLGLTSKSQGAGNSRFTVVSKTLRTVDAVDVQRILSAYSGSSSRRVSRKLVKDMSKGGSRVKTGGFGGSKSAASFRNGEIVGAGVPELGRENKGHRLMEKMGWTKGMALGKDGEGRLLPVEQIVRIGTAGLGGG